MKCKKCGSNMYVDDCERYSKGNQNVYYICNNDDCRVSCIKSIEDYEPVNYEWCLETKDDSNNLL